MKRLFFLLFLIMLIIARCGRCRSTHVLEEEVQITLPNHVAVTDMAFVYFSPEQISENEHNASDICRVLPSPSNSQKLEDHGIICFSDMEQYGVRLANGTRMNCHVEKVESSVSMEIATPVLQNSCILYPIYLPFEGNNQESQMNDFVFNHDALCHTNAATLRTCQSIDNRAFMELVSSHNFRSGNQIVTVEQPTSMKGWVFDMAVDLIKHYWKL